MTPATAPRSLVKLDVNHSPERTMGELHDLKKVLAFLRFAYTTTFAACLSKSTSMLYGN